MDTIWRNSAARFSSYASGQTRWHDASRSQWQEYTLEISEILHIFSSGAQSMGDGGSKKAYTGPTKFGCDRSIVVGCMSWNDRQTSRQTDKHESQTQPITVLRLDYMHARRCDVSRHPVSLVCCLFATVTFMQLQRGRHIGPVYQ